MTRWFAVAVSGCFDYHWTVVERDSVRSFRSAIQSEGLLRIVIEDRLPKALDTIFAWGSAPDQAQDETIELARSDFSLSTAFPLTEQMLPLVCERLTVELDAKDMLRRLVALTLADVFGYQRGKPVSRNDILRHIQVKHGAMNRNVFIQRNITPEHRRKHALQATATSIQNLKERMGKLQEEIKEDVLSGRKDAARIVSSLEAAEQMLSFRSTLFFRSWENFVSPTMRMWMRDLMNAPLRICENPQIQEALLSGKLERITPEIRVVFWSAMRGWREETTGLKDRKWQKEALDYFLSREDMLPIFWVFYAADPSKYDTDTYKFLKDIPDIRVAILKAALEQGEILFQSLFARFSLKEGIPVSTAVILRRLLLDVAKVKKGLSSNANKHLLVSELKKIIKTYRLSRHFAGLLAVLGDKKPGVIYGTPHGEARVSSPAKGETREELLSRLHGAKKPVAYISETGWEEEVITSRLLEERNDDPSFDGEVKLVSPWGNVLVPSEASVAKILHQIGEKSPVDMESVFEALSKYQERYRHPVNSRVVFPALLLESPITHLRSAGVLAVAQSADTVNILLHATGRRDEKIYLTGRVNDVGDLVLSGAPKDFMDTPLYYGLSCAVFFGRMLFSPPALTKEEIREARGVVKSWNAMAKKDGRPILSYNENPWQVDGVDVIYLVGAARKPILFSLRASHSSSEIDHRRGSFPPSPTV